MSTGRELVDQIIALTDEGQTLQVLPAPGSRDIKLILQSPSSEGLYHRDTVMYVSRRKLVAEEGFAGMVLVRAIATMRRNIQHVRE